MSQRIEKQLHVRALVHDAEIDAQVEELDEVAVRMMDGIIGDDGLEHPFPEDEAQEVLDAEDDEIEHLLESVDLSDLL